MLPASSGSLKFNANGVPESKLGSTGLVSVLRDVSREVFLAFSSSISIKESNEVEFPTIKEASSPI